MRRICVVLRLGGMPVTRGLRERCAEQADRLETCETVEVGWWEQKQGGPRKWSQHSEGDAIPSTRELGYWKACYLDRKPKGHLKSM